MSARGGASAWLYRRLLRLLPAELRNRHGADMEATFAAAHARARSVGAAAVLRLWLRELWDHARTGVALRRRERPRVTGRAPNASLMLLDDLRLAVRATTRRRAFFVLAALTLALGVGATTAMYSALRAVVLDPLPFAAAERLVKPAATFGDDTRVRLPLDPAQLTALHTEEQLFDALEAYSATTMTLTGLDEPERVRAMRVTAGLPGLLGVSPHIGRSFTVEEEAGAGARVALLDYSFWRSRFGGRVDVLGESIHLNGEAWTIIGVMPREAEAFGGAAALHVWTPLGASAPFRLSLARLADGVALETAVARVDALVSAESDGQRRGMLMSLREPGPLHEHLRILMVAVTLLLLVSCVNVANLLLHRVAALGTETAVRAALGASRTRLFRQFIFESTILAVTGGIVGAALAYGGLRALLAMRPEQLELLRHARIDGGVLLFCFAVSAAAGLLFGLLPAVRGSRPDATSALGRTGRGLLGGSARLRWALVSAEVALSFALLVGAALVVTSLRELSARDPGFRADGLVAVDVRLPAWRHPSEDARAAVFDDVVDAVRRLRRIESAVLASSVPPRVAISRFGHIRVEGAAREETPTAFHAVEAGPGLLETVGIGLVAGRGFLPEDYSAATNAVIVTRSTAARLFPGEDPVGRRFQVEGPPDFTVVGVVPDLLATGLTADASDPMLYLPQDRALSQLTSIAVRARDVDAQLLLDLRQTVRSVESDAVVDVATAGELLYASIARERFTTMLLTVFATLALALAAVGVYGVLSQVVISRTREIGVRMALGANAVAITTDVMRGGATATLAGLTAGALVAIAGIRALRSEIFGLSHGRIDVFATAAVILLVVALASMVLPAWRASRLDPLRAIATD